MGQNSKKFPAEIVNLCSRLSFTVQRSVAFRVDERDVAEGSFPFRRIPFRRISIRRISNHRIPNRRIPNRRTLTLTLTLP